MRAHPFALLACLTAAAGCSTSDNSPSYGSGNSDASDTSMPDAAQDTLADSATDSAADSASDAGNDGSQDAVSDTVQDTASDTEIPTDAPTDAIPVEVGPDGSCPGISAASDVDPWLMRSTSSGFGGIETASSGGHQDVFLRSPGNLTRIGVRLDWGGTVVFYGLSADPGSNVIDANDTGRELQIALYDPSRIRQPCAWNASCQTSTESCGNSITFLGWNPVQGGDECNRGAPVLSHGASGDSLEVVIQPLQWNPDWDKADCTQTPCGGAGRPVDVTYRMQYRFLSEHVVEIATEVSSQEAISHPVTGQEWPTLYVSHGQGGPDLPVLLTAAGQQVTIDVPANDGFFYKNFDSPAPWVSFQNAASNYGVGLGMDQGTLQYQGWYGNGSTAPYFHNVRAQVAFGLDAGAVVRGVSYLALGSFSTVKATLEAAFAARAPFGSLDEPAANAVFAYTPGSPITVRGWALDNAPGTQVRVEIDGVTAATIPLQGSRPDVCKVYPAYPSCPDVGFQGTVATTGLDGCAHLLRVVAVDTQGNERVLGERVIVGG